MTHPIDTDPITRREYREDLKSLYMEIDNLKEDKVSYKLFWILTSALFTLIGGMFLFISAQIHELQLQSQDSALAFTRLNTTFENVLQKYDIHVEP